MTALEIFQFGSYVLPIAAIVYQAGANRQRLKTLENQFKEFLTHCSACKEHLDGEDDKLHSRITENAKEIYRLKGRANGHG